MAFVIELTVRAWVVAVLALVAAGAGMSSLAGGTSTTSPLRIGLAAGVLSAYAATAAVVVTSRMKRTRVRCLFWGGTIPVLVGLVNAALVIPRAGLLPGAISALPWLTGALLAWIVGPWLPTLRLPTWGRRD